MAILDKQDPVVSHFTNHLRRVGGGYKLATTERLRQKGHNLPLPKRVHVHVDFIDQNNSDAVSDWIFEGWIGLREAASKVERQRKNASL